MHEQKSYSKHADFFFLAHVRKCIFVCKKSHHQSPIESFNIFFSATSEVKTIHLIEIGDMHIFMHTECLVFIYWITAKKVNHPQI